jgi:predicted phosphodiesterase
MMRTVATAILIALAAAAPCAGASDGSGSERAALRVVVIADINSSYGTVGYSPQVHTAIERIVGLEPDLVIGAGDLIAGQQRAPHLDRERLQAMWAAFDREVLAPLATAGIPFLPVPGNHDASAAPGFELERRIFEAFWRRHRPAVGFLSDEGYPFRYSVAASGVQVVVLDATTVGPLAPAQRDWVSGVLDPSQRYRARIVAAHLPLVAFSHGREREVLGDVELEKLLRERHVDLVLSGHHHAFFPGFRAGLRQVSLGCLGSGPRRLLGQVERSPRSFTLLEMSAGGEIAVHALIEPRFTDGIERGALPPALQHGGVRILRDDLAVGGAGP